MNILTFLFATHTHIQIPTTLSTATTTPTTFRRRCANSYWPTSWPCCCTWANRRRKSCAPARWRCAAFARCWMRRASTQWCRSICSTTGSCTTTCSWWTCWSWWSVVVAQGVGHVCRGLMLCVSANRVWSWTIAFRISSSQRCRSWRAVGRNCAPMLRLSSVSESWCLVFIQLLYDFSNPCAGILHSLYPSGIGHATEMVGQRMALLLRDEVPSVRVKVAQGLGYMFGDVWCRAWVLFGEPRCGLCKYGLCVWKRAQRIYAYVGMLIENTPNLQHTNHFMIYSLL